jgi:SAM-dependent methyltransferase
MPDDPPRERRRDSFERVADLYDRARPSYPDPVVDRLVELTRLRPGDRLLEIGCGTGQATHALADRGLAVICVERGERLAALARRNLARYPAVQVVNADFESWEPVRAGFDAVVAFTAFHWIDPELRYRRVAELLRPGGSLGVVVVHQVVKTGGDPFFLEAQEDYRAVGMAGDRPPGPPEAIDDLGDEVEASGLFENVVVERVSWETTATADEYVALLGTASDHLLLEPERREELFARIRRRIESRPGGTIRRNLLAVLHAAQRR